VKIELEYLNNGRETLRVAAMHQFESLVVVEPNLAQHSNFSK